MIDAGFKVRNFIEETIDTLKSSSEGVAKIWKEFQEGKINKKEFEDEYHHILHDWLSEMKHEANTPNNGCKYNETCPTSEYFKEQGI